MRAHLLLLSLLLAPLIGCDDQPAQGVCTALFAAISVTVQTQGGAPVTGLSITATNLRTGQSFGVPQSLGTGPGTYVVFDDNLRDRVRVSGDSVRVIGSDSAPRFTGYFVIDVPEGCHVRKVAGPDTVVVP